MKEKNILKYKNESILLGVFILLTIVFTIINPRFIRLTQWKSLASIVSYRLILAIGMSVILATGGIDLSIGSIIALSGIIMAVLMKRDMHPFLAFLIASMGSTFMGGLNGYIIDKSKINPFIITLASSAVYRGIALVITKGMPISKFPQSFLFWGTGEIFGISITAYIALLIGFISYILLYKTKWGLYIRVLGGNEKSLERMGVNTSIYRVSAYAFIGLLASYVSLVLTARLNTAEANTGMNLGMDAITAVIMGGALLQGGNIRLQGTVISVFILGLIRSGLTSIGANAYYQELITGLILLFSVLVSNYADTKKTK